MYKLHLIFLVFLTLLLSSCSEGNQTESKIEVSFSSLMQDLSFDGGAILQITHAETGVVSVYDLSKSNVARIPHGKWNMHFVGFEGSDSWLGPYRCGEAKGVELSQAEQTIDIIVDKDCSQLPYLRIIDSRDPAIMLAITTPIEDLFVNFTNASNFFLTGTCAVNGSSNVMIQGPHGVVATNCSSNLWSYGFDFSTLGDGNINLDVKQVNPVTSRVYQVSTVLVKDTVTALVSITSPAANTYINSQNMSSFAINGTCSDDGLQSVIIKVASTIIGEANCFTGLWTANLDFSSFSEGEVIVGVVHKDLAGNLSNEEMRSFIKDSLPPFLSWEGAFNGLCVGSANESSFNVQGSCSAGEGNVIITSPLLSSTQNIACSGGFFSVGINLDTTGLAINDIFNIQVSQADVAGNISSLSNGFKYIAGTTPNIVFGGWDDVYAVGKKTYTDGNPSEAGFVRLKWKEWPATNTCRPEGIKVYRADAPGSPLGSKTLLTGPEGMSPDSTSYLDGSLDDLDFSKAWYYSLQLRIAGIEYDVVYPTEISEIRIIAPPANMALVHRWITNQEVCGLMGLPTDPSNHYRCPYTGQGNVGGYHDMEHDLLVDRFETGCNVSSTCGAGGNTTCASQHFGNLENPSTGPGVPGTVGSVYYDSAGSARGRCWIKTGAADTAWSNLTSAVSSELAVAATNEAHAPPLVWLTRDMYAVACSAKSETIDQVVEYAGNSSNTSSIEKRLLRMKEWKAAAAWNNEPGHFPLVYTDSEDWIDHLEKSAFKTGDASERVGKCNTNMYKGSLSPAARDYLGNFDINGSNFETGSKIATIDCQSRYGIQDMVGNVQEKVSDELTCSGTDNKLCYGQTSSIDPGNTAIDGFAFDGVQGVDGSIIVGDIVYYYGTHSANFFNVLLGLPLRNDDGAGAIAKSAWASNGKFHWDRFSYINTSVTTQETTRYGNMGGFFAYGNDGKYGRWYSSFMYGPSAAAQMMGSRCMLQVK